jgi:sugar phosphate isomerase/epimerase
MLGQTVTAAGVAALLAQPAPASAGERPAAEPFGYSLNTSTIRGQKLPLVTELEIAARAGYQAVEPWISEVDAYVAGGGTLAELRKRIVELGLEVAGVIGFAEWIVDDEARRAKGLAEARRIMDITAQLGGRAIAAPPAGVSERDQLDPTTMAARYRVLLDLGQQMAVTPQLELWGFARVLSKLGEVAQVAVDAAHPRASILADSYHLYKGGSDVAGLRLLNGAAMHVFHVNDYPAAPPRKDITDAHRVFPGDGIAPLDLLFRALRDNGFRGMLSLEVFNRDYWTHDPLFVARTGLEKMRAAVQKSLA